MSIPILSINAENVNQFFERKKTKYIEIDNVYYQTEWTEEAVQLRLNYLKQKQLDQKAREYREKHPKKEKEKKERTLVDIIKYRREYYLKQKELKKSI
jgi:hypothetical protein